MAVEIELLAPSSDIEDILNFTGTFINTGGGFTAALPVKYCADGERYTKAVELMELVAPYTCYRPNAIKSVIAVNTDPSPKPLDPGSEPPSVYMQFGFKPTGSLIEHKDGFFLPGALFADDGDLELLGNSIADALSHAGCEVRFKRGK